jgi:hypothetical protein
MISSILHVTRNELSWRATHAGYGPHKTLYDGFIQWSASAWSTASSLTSQVKPVSSTA